MFELNDEEIKIIKYAIERVTRLWKQELQNLQQQGAFPDWQEQLQKLISTIDTIYKKFSGKRHLT